LSVEIAKVQEEAFDIMFSHEIDNQDILHLADSVVDVTNKIIEIENQNKKILSKFKIKNTKDFKDLIKELEDHEQRREIEEECGFPVYSVVDVYDIIEFLEEKSENAENVERIKKYLSVHGATL
jgi:hypothetical protein